ncbi:MAG TPA: site-2 protease family protein [Anaerolineales bacterium]|nr:site-2 protease family protein [Anaerolineales bacterium]
MPIPEIEILNSLVSRVFRIEDFTMGDPAQGSIARYRGQLITEDSVAAYDQLTDSLKPYDITPLFRMDHGRQVVFLVPKKPAPKPARTSINMVLFILTVLSVMLVGAEKQVAPTLPGILGQAIAIFETMLSGWPYAVSLMSILLAHEFGHYFMSRHHRTAATLPYFIPLPFPPLGTMGAAILMQGTPKNKRVLFDIGVAGPLAGIIVAIPVLFYGLSISKLSVIRPVPGMLLEQEGNSIFYLLAKYMIFGKLLPDPASTHGLSLGAYWIRYFFTGQPFPMGATDVITSSIAFAGWAGLLVTALNLIPAGTLDGGHVIYSLFGDQARKLFPFIWGALILLGVFWSGWWLWAVLLLWLGRVHAEPLDQITPLDPRRRAIAVLVIVIFILTFSPVPFAVFGSL